MEFPSKSLPFDTIYSGNQGKKLAPLQMVQQPGSGPGPGSGPVPHPRNGHQNFQVDPQNGQIIPQNRKRKQMSNDGPIYSNSNQNDQPVNKAVKKITIPVHPQQHLLQQQNVPGMGVQMQGQNQQSGLQNHRQQALQHSQGNFASSNQVHNQVQNSQYQSLLNGHNQGCCVKNACVTAVCFFETPCVMRCLIFLW